MMRNPVIVAFTVLIYVVFCNAASASNRVVRRQSASGCTAKSPPPEDVVCNQHGNIDPNAVGPFPIGADQFTSLNTCRDFCLRRTTNPTLRPDTGIASCVAFGWNSTSRVCSLYDQNLKQLKFEQDDSSKVIFSSKQCYSCPKECPPKGTANLIDNPGFEISKKLFGPWTPEFQGAGEFTVVSPGHNSPNALRVPGGNNLIQFRSMCAGEIYTYSMDVRVIKTSSSDPTIGGEIAAHTGSLDFRHTYPSTTPGWQTLFWTFEANDFDPHVEIDISNFDLLIDNVAVVPAPSKFRTTGASIVKNGGFESGNLGPWVLQTDPGPGTPQASVVRPSLTEGKFKFQFSQDTAPPDGGISTGGFDLLQNVTTVVGKRYLFSVDFLSNPSVPDGDMDALHPSYSFSIGGYSWESSLLSDVPVNKVASFSRVFTATDTKSLISVGFHTIDQHTQVQRTALDNIRVVALA